MRLNSEDRRSIIDSAISHAFDEREKANNAEIDHLGVKIYETVFKNILPVFKDEKWVHKSSVLKFNLRGFKATFKLSNPVFVPIDMARGNEYYPVSNEEFKKRFDHLHNEAEAINIDRELARAYLTEFLSRVYTLSKLETVWPEGKQFYSQLEPAQRSEVPAIQVADLNKLLRL